MKCRHTIETCRGRWSNSEYVQDGLLLCAYSVVCECGATIPLGPANDAPPEVAIEILAARLAGKPLYAAREHSAPACDDKGPIEDCIGCGYLDHELDIVPSATRTGLAWAGWLARAIDTHETP